ncbi:MAG TPA: hypothetical protein VG271_01215 [Beijerinckiaceae bacterium]|jgi:hypothetical protein|nr:hypothetical protein [Beijerinckiaceae bacterium]
MVRKSSWVELLDAAEAAGYATVGGYDMGPRKSTGLVALGHRSWLRFAPEVTTAALVLVTRLFAVLLAMA